MPLRKPSGVCSHKKTRVFVGDDVHGVPFDPPSPRTPLFARNPPRVRDRTSIRLREVFLRGMGRRRRLSWAGKDNSRDRLRVLLFWDAVDVVPYGHGRERYIAVTKRSFLLRPPLFAPHPSVTGRKTSRPINKKPEKKAVLLPSRVFFCRKSRVKKRAGSP